MIPSIQSRGSRAKSAFAILIASATLSAAAMAQSTELTVLRSREFVTGAPKGGIVSPARRNYKLRNTGASSAQWSASTGADWLSISPSSGTLAPGATVTMQFSVDQSIAVGFPLGQRQATVAIRDDTQQADVDNINAEVHIGFTIDVDGHFRLNGRPYVPIGVWAQPPEDGWASFHADLGMNLLVGNGYTTLATNPDFLDAAEAHGMMGMVNYDANVQEHPALLGWYLFDEPDIHNTPPSEVLATYNSWKAQDPNHQIMMNLTGFFYHDATWGNDSQDQLYMEYTAIPDFVAFDFYPVSGFNRPELLYVPGAATEMMRDHFLDGRAPVFTWIEAADINHQYVPLSAPGPTAEQMRFEVWDSIIRGAKAIGYFTISFDPWSWANLTPEIEVELRRTNRDLERLTPLITAPDAPVNLTVTEQAGQDVHYMVKRRGRTVFVFVSNADMHQPYRPASMTFTFDQAPTGVQVYGENRSLTATGNSFTDSFAPLATRVYIVRF